MKLEVAVADVPQSKKDLTIEVAADEVKAEFDKTYEAFSRYVKVPGFRPGRAPRGVVKQRFAKEVKDEVVGRLLPHALQHAIIDHKLRVVGQPQVDDISLNEGEPLRFKAIVEVIPEFELKPYKGLKARRQVAQVTDRDVDEVIGEWREAQAEFVPVEDRPSQEGDFVSIDLAGKYVEPPTESTKPAEPTKEDLKLDNLQIELGSRSVQPEFDENLRGVKSGEMREFRVSYPEDHEAKDLAGRTLDFTVNVVAVRRKELPELDDDFIRGLGEFETLEQARERVREGLTKDAERRADMKLRDQLLEQIRDNYDFEVPPSLIEQEAVNRTRDFAYWLMREGASADLIRDMDWEERLARARVDAVRDVRAALVVSRIGAAEGIQITTEEVDAEIDRMAARSGQAPDQLRARLTKEEALSSIENRLIYQKALDLVVNSAEVTVEEPVQGEKPGQTDREQQEAAEAKAPEANEANEAAETNRS